MTISKTEQYKFLISQISQSRHEIIVMSMKPRLCERASKETTYIRHMYNRSFWGWDFLSNHLAMVLYKLNPQTQDKHNKPKDKH